MITLVRLHAKSITTAEEATEVEVDARASNHKTQYTRTTAEGKK
jgi:hypothetical protein